MDDEKEIPERNILFFCETCYKIPNVQIIFENGEPYLVITCECGYKKEQLSKYLTNIIKKSEKNSIRHFLLQKPICGMDKEHNMRKSLYCLNCNLWLCNKCLQIHNELSESPHSFLDNKVLVNTICDVHTKTSASFYCETCHKSICYYCSKTIHSNHFFENLKNKFMKIECEINRNIIYKFYSKNKNINSYSTDIILNVINQEIKKLKNMKEMVLKEFKKQNEINYNIYSFISILYDNYSQNKKYNNYQIIKNLLDNTNFKKNLDDSILKIKSKDINIDSMFKQYLLVLSNNKLIEPKYPIILSELDKNQIENTINSLIVVEDYIIVKNSNSFSFYSKDDLKMKKCFTYDIGIGKILDLKNKNLAIAVTNIIKIFNYDIFKSTHSIVENNLIIEMILSENTNILILTKENKINLYDYEKKKNIKLFDFNYEINNLIELNSSVMICSTKNKVLELNQNRDKNPVVIFKYKNKINIIYKLITGNFIVGSKEKISIYFDDKGIYSEIVFFYNDCNIINICEFLQKFIFVSFEGKTFKIYDYKTFNLSYVFIKESNIEFLSQFDDKNLISFSKNQLKIWSVEMNLDNLLGASIIIFND